MNTQSGRFDSLIGFVLALAITATLMLPGMREASAQQVEQRTHQFDLPRQALADSLRAVGSKAGTNVVFDPAAVRGKESPSLRGTYTAEEAIKRLLDGSGLSVRKTEGGSLLVSQGEGGAQPATDP